MTFCQNSPRANNFAITFSAPTSIFALTHMHLILFLSLSSQMTIGGYVGVETQLCYYYSSPFILLKKCERNERV